MDIKFFICRNKISRNDGTCNVRAYVPLSSGRIRVATGISVDPKTWNDRMQLVTSGRNAKAINSALDAIRIRIAKFLLDRKTEGESGSITLEDVKSIIEYGRVKHDTFTEVWTKFMKLKKGRTKELYNQTLKKILDYDKHPDFDGMTRSWIEGLANHMSDLAVNTRAIHLRNLRCVVNFAIDEDVTAKNGFRRWHIPTEDTPMRVLPVEDMRWLLHAQHLNKVYAEYRDMFMLMVYLRGINIVDLASLTHDSIKNGRIEYRRHKTGTLYSIKIEPEASVILERYRGRRLLLAPFERYANYQDYARRMNDALQRIGELKTRRDGSVVKTRNHFNVMEPKFPDITTYYARYSWATYAARLGIQRDTISEGLGHKYGSKITGIYIEFDREKIDEANRMVIDYIFGR